MCAMRQECRRRRALGAKSSTAAWRCRHRPWPRREVAVHRRRAARSWRCRKSSVFVLQRSDVAVNLSDRIELLIAIHVAQFMDRLAHQRGVDASFPLCFEHVLDPHRTAALPERCGLLLGCLHVSVKIEDQGRTPRCRNKYENRVGQGIEAEAIEPPHGTGYALRQGFYPLAPI